MLVGTKGRVVCYSFIVNDNPGAVRSHWSVLSFQELCTWKHSYVCGINLWKISCVIVIDHFMLGLKPPEAILSSPKGVNICMVWDQESLVPVESLLYCTCELLLFEGNPSFRIVLVAYHRWPCPSLNLLLLTVSLSPTRLPCMMPCQSWKGYSISYCFK